MIVRRVASIVAAVFVLVLSAAPAMAEPNENACTGQALKAAALANGGAGKAIRDFGFEPSDLGGQIAGLNEECHQR
jgi:hypothetical protein